MGLCSAHVWSTNDIPVCTCSINFVSLIPRAGPMATLKEGKGSCELGLNPWAYTLSNFHTPIRSQLRHSHMTISLLQEYYNITAATQLH